IFPVLWFGGNAAAATMIQIRLSDLRSEVERMNEGNTVSFDPASQTVVFDGEEAMSGVASRLSAAQRRRGRRNSPPDGT
ncbi:hypothetical protein ACC728_39635, partial [Rhizobium ruizarguesonis]